MSKDRMLRASRRSAVRTNRCAWFGSNTQAYTVQAPCSARIVTRVTKPARSAFSRKMAVRSTLRNITWCRAPVASSRGCRGMAAGIVA